MNKFTIVESTNGHEIYVNLIVSPAGQYLSRHPHVINLIKEALTTAELSGSRVVVEQDMGRGIGTTDIIVTTDKDVIYYAQPVKTEVFSRFARNKFPQVCQTLTIIAEQDIEGNYEIRDTWVGPFSPPFPGDELETAESKAYWETHALVQDAQPIQSKTITKVCPY